MSEFTKQVEKALAQATPGPWEKCINALPGIQIESECFHISSINGGDNRENNAELIANAPTWIRQLLEERQLLVDTLRQQMDGAYSWQVGKIMDVLENVGERP